MNNKGITLIALVITIIVLLILAGVSIAMLTGQNGILTQSSNSKDKTNAAEVAERVNMELNAQLSRAMAGESFNTAEDIVKNIGTLPTGYTLTKDDIISSATELSIKVKGTDVSKLDPAVATITKGATSWSVTSTVKAK
jgi:Tfp pilus assembly protein PilE